MSVRAPREVMGRSRPVSEETPCHFPPIKFGKPIYGAVNCNAVLFNHQMSSGRRVTLQMSCILIRCPTRTGSTSTPAEDDAGSQRPPHAHDLWRLEFISAFSVVVLPTERERGKGRKVM